MQMANNHVIVTIGVYLDIEKGSKRDLDIELNKLEEGACLLWRKLQLLMGQQHCFAKELTPLPSPPLSTGSLKGVKGSAGPKRPVSLTKG